MEEQDILNKAKEIYIEAIQHLGGKIDYIKNNEICWHDSKIKVTITGDILHPPVIIKEEKCI